MNHITVPYPPTANLYWRHWRNRVVTSPVAKQYRNTVAGIAKLRWPKPFDGPCALRVSVYRPAKRGDLDNTLKVLLDALRGVVFIDDDQVVQIVANRRDDKANPRAVVEVVPFAEVPL